VILGEIASVPFPKSNVICSVRFNNGDTPVQYISTYRIVVYQQSAIADQRQGFTFANK